MFARVCSSDGEDRRGGLRVWRIFVAAVVVGAALVVGVGTASADVMFSDGFESNSFSAWSPGLKTASGGTGVVQSSIVSSGSYAAKLSETSASGSKAYVREKLTSSQVDLTATGDFQVLQEGASGGNVPFFRFFAGDGTTRIINLYRQNVTGKLQVGYGGANFATSAKLVLNTWYTVQLHVVIAGATSTVQVQLGGNPVYSTTTANLGTTQAAIVQIGNDTAAQAFTLVADNINVQNGGQLSPPSNTAAPAIAGEALQGQVLSASAGSWSGTQPIGYTYQWQRCDTNGTNCANIGSPTPASTYTVASADLGFTIVVEVTATNSAGSAIAYSAATAVVALSPPVNTAPPPIPSGPAQQGQTLTASHGNWTGAPSYVYQWQRCDTSGENCTNVGSATLTSTYTLTSADVGSTIVVAVTASNAAGSATAVSAPTAVVQASSNTLFSDGFESGNFSAWSPGLKTAGDGTGVVQSSIVSSGSYAAKLSETSASGSKSYVRETLANQVDLTASGDFQVLQQGASGGNVPFFRFFASDGTTRIITLYRQNGTGKLQVGYGGGNIATSATITLNTWYTVQLHVVIAGATSTVEVKLGGNPVYSTTSANLGTTKAAIVQIGNDTAAQAFTLVADNITAQTSNTGPPVETAPPGISGSAQQGQTLTASPGGWSGAPTITYAYQWQRCDTSGANCTNVGSGDSTYTLTSADVGSTIVVEVTASNSAGSAMAPSAATMIVWTSSVVALWHMDESTGTTMLDSAGQNNGTLTSSVTPGQPGFSGFAYYFSGSSSYVSVPSADSMNPGSANFSFTIALQTNGTPPLPPQDWDLIRKGDITTQGGEYKLEFQNSGQASCGFKGSTSYAEIQGGPALNDGNWHTITCVKTASDIELIVDGQTFSTPATVGSISNTAPVTIGSHPGADWYVGLLDEANISIGSS